MKLLLGAIKAFERPFSSFDVSKVSVDARDTKSLYKVLRQLRDDGMLDSYFEGNELSFKGAQGAIGALANHQREGRYTLGQNVIKEITGNKSVQIQIFYNAMVRFLQRRGFSTSFRPKPNHKAAPIYGDSRVERLVLKRDRDIAFLLGFRYALEVRQGGEAILWMDPVVFVYESYSGKYMKRSWITRSGYSQQMKALSVIRPSERLDRLKLIISLLEDGGQIRVEYADGSSISFSTELIKVEE